MKIIKDQIKINEIEEMAKNMFGDFVKVVIDIEKEIIALDAELHADQEALLIEKGSSQKDLWGINLYPEMHASDDFIEFDSMINLRPSQGNKSRGVDDEKNQNKIKQIINKIVIK